MLQHNESHGADLVGTPQYMAPEVLEGDVSSAGDIWAVGVTCLQLLTGKGLLDIVCSVSRALCRMRVYLHAHVCSCVCARARG